MGLTPLSMSLETAVSMIQEPFDGKERAMAYEFEGIDYSCSCLVQASELCMVPFRNSRGPAVEDLRDSGIYKKGSGERNVLSYDMGGTPSMCLCQPLKMASLS